MPSAPRGSLAADPRCTGRGHAGRAGAVRAELCGPSTVPVISRSCRLDLGRGLLHLLVARSIVITVAQAPAPALARAAEVAEVSSPGGATSTWQPPWTRSGARLPHGAGRGRATLNGQLAAAGLLEVLCLTFPSLVGADAKRILAGVALAEPAAQLALRAGQVPVPPPPHDLDEVAIDLWNPRVRKGVADPPGSVFGSGLGGCAAVRSCP